MHYGHHFQHEPVVELVFRSTAQYELIDLPNDFPEYEIPSLLWTGHIIQLTVYLLKSKDEFSIKKQPTYV